MSFPLTATVLEGACTKRLPKLTVPIVVTFVLWGNDSGIKRLGDSNPQTPKF